MVDLLRPALSNAIAAAALAVVVAVVALPLRRRPAIVHALWLIVLLKLITPPLWSVPVEWRSATPEKARVESAAEVGLGDVEFLSLDEATLTIIPSSTVAAAPLAAPLDWTLPLLTTACVVWVLGSACCLLTVTIRSWQFHRLLRHATPAPASVCNQTRSIASRFAIRDCPAVWFVPGAVCPMLYVVAGHARLLLPCGLWERLDDRQRDTLIAHELAHLCRRDHWVRLVEVAATVLYWWNPVVWWARQSLREAEEQCCDAWVIWSMPAAVRDYMSAILEAVEFVSETNPLGGTPRFAPAAVPALASGMGEFRRIERRLWMIRRNESPRRLSRPGMVVVFLAAGAALPMAPSLAQEKAPHGEKHPQLIVTQSPGSALNEPQTNVSGDHVITHGARIVTSEGTFEVDPGSRIVTEGTSLTFRGDGTAVVVPKNATGTGAPNKIRNVNVREVRGAAIQFTAASELDQARAAFEQARANLEVARTRLAQLEAQARKGQSVKGEHVVRRLEADDLMLMDKMKAKKAEHTDRSKDERMEKLEQKFEQLEELLKEMREMRDRRQEGGGHKSEAPNIGLQLQGN